MSRQEGMPSLHVITPEGMDEKRLVQCASEVAAFVDFIHLRQKKKSARELWLLAEQIIQQGVDAGKVIVNDRLDVAMVLEAHAVQLAYNSLPSDRVVEWLRSMARTSLRVGCSVHSVAEAQRAQDSGADYALFGHVFDTASKPGKPAQGLGYLAQVVRSVAIPVIALGGITPQSVPSVLATGCAGIAVLSGVFQAVSPVDAAQAYREAMR